MREGSRDVSFDQLRENPGQYKGRLYIFGGIIVNAKFIKAGSEIEAVHVPVDSYGYFRERGVSEGRFLAVLPGNGQLLDPAVYGRGRRVTLAAEFIETQKGMIDEMEYSYPLFRIRQIYLWPNEGAYYYAPYYYDPWFYPYPYYYWGPWWSFSFFSGPVRPPAIRRTNPPSQPPPQRREIVPEREPERR